MAKSKVNKTNPFSIKKGQPKKILNRVSDNQIFRKENDKAQ